jgi:hypothetical protein
LILLKTRKKNKKLTDSITEKKQVKVFGKESEKKPFSKGFLSVRARREGKNKLDVLLRVLRFFVVKIFPDTFGPGSSTLCRSLSRFL